MEYVKKNTFLTGASAEALTPSPSSLALSGNIKFLQIWYIYKYIFLNKKTLSGLFLKKEKNGL